MVSRGQQRQINRGRWQLNTSFLKKHDYIQLINNAIIDEQQKYASDETTLKDLEKENKYSMDDDILLEMVVCSETEN